MYLLYGSILLLLVISAITYITLKKPVYGTVLAIVCVLFVALVVFWYFQEAHTNEQQLARIHPNEVRLEQATLKVAYGNRYLYQVKITNQSDKYILSTIQFRLNLSGSQPEQITQWRKLWLDPQASQWFKIYFSSQNLATTQALKKWQVSILQVNARK